MRPALACFAAALLTASCSDDAQPVDAGAPDGGSTTMVAPPAEALAPVLTPCPPGWREVPAPDGPTSCDPWPEPGPVDCPVGEAHFPGGSGCMPVGAPCPSGPFADDLPAGAVFVDASAPAGGTGTSASPFATVAEARAALPATGGVIALARGTHDTEVRVESGDLTVIGACARETTLTRTMGTAPRAIASARGGHLTLRNLRLTGAHVAVASMVDSRSLLVVEGVQIDGTSTSAGVAFDGARLEVRDSVVRDTVEGPGAGETGRGFQPLDGGAVVLERVVIERVRDVAVVVGTASASLTDVAIRGVAFTGAGDKGRAVELFGGSEVDLTHVVIEDGNDVALLAGQAGTLLRAEDVLVRRIRTTSAATRGRGLEVVQGARAELSRVVFDEASEIGVFVRGDGTTALLTDVVIARTTPRPEGTFGRAIEASLPAAAMLERVHVSDNRDVAVLVTDGALVTATDLVVQHTESEEASATLGTGIGVQLGSSLVLSRARASDNRSHGLFVFGEGTTADVSDLVARDTRGWETGGLGGLGAGVQNGARLSVTRGLFERNREVAVLSIYSAEVTLADVAATGTMNRDCAGSSECGELSVGLAAVHGGRMTADRFLVVDGQFIGVQVAVSGEMDLMNGEVRGHRIGAAVGTGGYDVTRLSTGVAYVDNDVNLDSTELPVPGGIDPHVGAE